MEEEEEEGNDIPPKGQSLERPEQPEQNRSVSVRRLQGDHAAKKQRRPNASFNIVKTQSSVDLSPAKLRATAFPPEQPRSVCQQSGLCDITNSYMAKENLALKQLKILSDNSDRNRANTGQTSTVASCSREGLESHLAGPLSPARHSASHQVPPRARSSASPPPLHTKHLRLTPMRQLI